MAWSVSSVLKAMAFEGNFLVAISTEKLGFRYTRLIRSG